MASIVETITGDKAVQLGIGEEFVRPLSFGNQWSKIRIGMRLAINGNANLGAGLQRLGFGLCNGNQLTYKSSSCVSWVGISWGINPGAAWTYDAVNNWYAVYSGGSVSYVTTKVGATVTDTSTGNNTPHYISGTLRNAPSIIMTQIDRVSSSSYSVKGYMPGGVQVASTPSFYDLMRCMEDEEMNTIANGGYGRTFVDHNLSSATATGVSSTLDTLSFFWERASLPTIEVSDLCVLRFY